MQPRSVSVYIYTSKLTSSFNIFILKYFFKNNIFIPLKMLLSVCFCSLFVHKAFRTIVFKDTLIEGVWGERTHSSKTFLIDG